MATKAIDARTNERSARQAEDRGRAAEKLPHERDEAAGSTDGAPDPKVQQAHSDLRRGLQDTDRGPVTDSTYRKLKD